MDKQKQKELLIELMDTDQKHGMYENKITMENSNTQSEVNDREKIHKYLKTRGMNPKDRLTKDNGGQYLDNFLIEFYDFCRDNVFEEVVTEVRRLRKLPKSDSSNYYCNKCGSIKPW